ncbi:MAG: TetR/AcrR family transcriptional regulator [Bdellovibrio sp.]
MTETSQNRKAKGESSSAVKPKKRDRSLSEDRLLSAALEIFSKNGFNGTTTRMIAKKADVNESLIGRYFEGKEGLLIAVIERFLEELLHREIPYPPQESLSHELELYVKDRLTLGCRSENESFAKIIFSQALVDRKFKKQVRETVPMQLDAKLVERIQLLYDKGKLKKDTDVNALCQDIDTFLDGMFFFERILHETSDEEILMRTLRFVTTYAKLFEAR